MSAFFATVSEGPMETVGTINIHNNIHLHCNFGNHPPSNRVIPSRHHLYNGQFASLHPATGSFASHATARIVADTAICPAGTHRVIKVFSRPEIHFLIHWPRGAP
jgi:hypothetical protein